MADNAQQADGVGVHHPPPRRRPAAVYEPFVLVARVVEILAAAGITVRVDERNVEAVMDLAADLLQSLGVTPVVPVLSVRRP